MLGTVHQEMQMQAGPTDAAQQHSNSQDLYPDFQ